MQKVENIIRNEMNNAGAQEILMPMVQPASLWEESGRIDQYGQELLVFLDRHDNKFCLGPTMKKLLQIYVKTFLLAINSCLLPSIKFKLNSEMR